jgi:hypothetical protein
MLLWGRRCLARRYSAPRRKLSLLPLDDCLYAQATIPHLTRSSLHRRFQRHEISRLPAIEGETGRKNVFKRYPIGYFHIDIAEVRSQESNLHLFVAIDRTSNFAFAQLRERANRHTATAFLNALIAVVPYKIHILTDKGFANAVHCRWPRPRRMRSQPRPYARRRHRTVRTEGCLSNKTALAIVFKLAETAEKSWRRLDGRNLLPKLIRASARCTGFTQSPIVRYVQI